MINRHLFTSKPSRWETVADVSLAVVIAVALCMTLLHSLDALFY